MPVRRPVLCACLAALMLAGCAEDPLGRDVIAQAHSGDQIAFDVVKIDDAVVTTLLAQPKPEFRSRFAPYQPAPELKIAIGDTVSVVIWESAANGLFGNSLTELSFPAGAAARLLTGQQPSPLGGMPGLSADLTASPDTLRQLFGGGAGIGAAAAPGMQREQRLEALLELAAQTGRAGTRIPDQPVGPDGAISIPYAGRLAVAGRRVSEVEQQVTQALGGKALDPQVLVAVKRSAANSVTVAGEVIGGARVPLSAGGDRLSQVIAAAGGARTPPHDTLVRLSRDGVTAALPLAALVGDPEQDIFARPGDVLTLVRRPQTFSVFGATGTNAAITFNSEWLSLSEALAKAGGLIDDRADARAVFLFRYEPVAVVKALGQPVASYTPDGLSPVAYRLDLREAKSLALAGRFPVRDKDTIFVANAETVRINRFFSALNLLTGPILSGVVVCANSNC